MQCEVCGVKCAVSSMQCEVCSVKYAVCSIQFALLLCRDQGAGSHLFQASILFVGGSVINGIYPVYFLSLGRDGVTIISFFSVKVMRTSPALYQETPPEMFQINYIMFKPH